MREMKEMKKLAIEMENEGKGNQMKNAQPALAKFSKTLEAFVLKLNFGFKKLTFFMNDDHAKVYIAYHRK